ncbi:MAG: TonB-dependent receptor [Bacteroidales bacterium]|nr:TonB-dependent receptor [Bacteroidales bacterium]
MYFKYFCFALLLSLSFPGRILAQDIVGKVLHQDTGEPLAGVVVLQGDTLLAKTDGQGVFRCPQASRHSLRRLTFSGVGYVTQTLQLSPSLRKPLVVRLRERFSNLDEVVVTTTRKPRSLKDEPVITHVFTAKQIERLAAPALQDVLTSIIPGVQFEAQRNGGGATQSLRIQGLGGSYILFLLDGEPLSAKNGENFLNRRGGQIDFSRIDVNSIERIEYLPSGGSILHGSNSVGGVVNIITKRATRPLQLQAGLRSTFPHQQRYELNGGRGTKKADFRFNTAYTRNHEYTGYEETVKTANGRDSLARVVLPSSDQFTANLSGNYRPTEGLHLRSALNLARSSIYLQREDDSFRTQAYNTLSGGGQIGLQWQIAPKHSLDASVAVDHAERKIEGYDKTTKQTAQRSDYQNLLLITRAQYSWEPTPQHTTILGLENVAEQGKSQWLKDSDGHAQNNAVAYVQHDAKFFRNTFYLSYGLRYDHNSSFGGHFLQRLSLMQKIKKWDLRLLYSESFRSPSFTERFAEVSDPTGRFFYKGNPDLKPETSRRYTLQLGYTHRLWSFSGSAFRVDVKDLIENQNFPNGKGGFDLRGVNTDKHVTYYGVETMLRGQLPTGTYWQSSYSFSKNISRTVKDQKGQGYNTSIVRPHSLTATIGQSFKWRHTNIDLNLTARYMAEVVFWQKKAANDQRQYEHEIQVPTGPNTLVYYRNVEDAYSNLRFTAAFKWRKTYTLQVGVDNLTNYKPTRNNFTSALTDGRRLFASFYVDLDRLWSKGR